MKRIALIIFGGAVYFVSAYADTLPQTSSSPVTATTTQSEGEDEDVVRLNTRYGLVQYHKLGSMVTVNDARVYDGVGVDVLRHLGVFNLSNEYVILFEGGNTGSGGTQGETFFLILKQNKAPLVIRAQITPLENRIKKAWQDKDVIYVDFEVGDYDEIKPPLKFVMDKVILDKALPALYAKTGPRLTDDNCKQLYGISLDDCSTKLTERHEVCTKSANAKSGIGMGGGEGRYFAWISHLPGFNESEFNKNCLAWCKGKEVSYKQFSKTVCNIR